MSPAIERLAATNVLLVSHYDFQVTHAITRAIDLVLALVFMYLHFMEYVPGLPLTLDFATVCMVAHEKTFIVSF